MTDIEMGIDPLIQRLIGVYYASGIWQNDKESKLGNFARILIFLFCTFSYPMAFIVGGVVSDDLEDSVFLWTFGIIIAVLEFKGFYVFFEKDTILTLLNATCIQSVPNNEQLLRKVNKTLNIFKKCSVAFLVVSTCLTSIIIIFSSPLITHKMPFNIWFPFDYEKSRSARWTVHFFVFVNEVYVMIVSFLSSITWYIMFNCSIKYDVLGYRFRNFGVLGRSSMDNGVVSESKHDTFEGELIECIQMHQQLEKYGIIPRGK